ncbi:MAG: bifunctional DNA primase/polymerase [bacterium]
MPQILKTKELIEFFYNAGFDLHPLLPNSKVPSRKDWNNLKKLSKDEILSLYKDNIPSEHGYNLGFRPGKWSLAVVDGVEYCITVIDIDIKANDKHPAGLDRSKLFKKEPAEYEKYQKRAAFASDWLEKLNFNVNVITGSGGFHSYLLIHTDIYDTLALKANQTIYKNDELGIEIELLADGKNVVLPPSKVELNSYIREYKLINDSFNFIDDQAHGIINLIKPPQPQEAQEPVIYKEPVNPFNAEKNGNITAMITELAQNKEKLNGFEFELNLIGYCKNAAKKN